MVDKAAIRITLPKELKDAASEFLKANKISFPEAIRLFLAHLADKHNLEWRDSSDESDIEVKDNKGAGAPRKTNKDCDFDIKKEIDIFIRKIRKK